jgi:flagellar basal body-associated protein FliL
MNQDMSAGRPSMPEKPKKNNTWLIIIVVLVVLCCLCFAVTYFGYQFGDQVLKILGLSQ